MTLYQLIKAITHTNYNVFLSNDITDITGELLPIKGTEEIKLHLDYKVVSIDESFNIVIRGSSIC